jgi:hypothetical protein
MDRPHAATELNRQVEALGVIGQIDDDLVAARVPVRFARKVKAGKRVIAGPT